MEEDQGIVKTIAIKMNRIIDLQEFGDSGNVKKCILKLEHTGLGNSSVNHSVVPDSL